MSSEAAARGMLYVAVAPERPNNSSEEADDGATVGINHARPARYTTLRGLTVCARARVCVRARPAGKKFPKCTTRVLWKNAALVERYASPRALKDG